MSARPMVPPSVAVTRLESGLPPHLWRLPVGASALCSFLPAWVDGPVGLGCWDARYFCYPASAEECEPAENAAASAEAVKLAVGMQTLHAVQTRSVVPAKWPHSRLW